MQIVIDIPESTYKIFKRLSSIIGVLVYEKDILTLIKAVKNGIPLPKGHGRLIDVGDLMPDSDYKDGIFYAVSVGVINGAPTIIEADNEDKE